MKIPLRYSMNMGVLTENELSKLNETSVTIVGLGGLGGNVANQLIRLGVKKVILVDFDRFSETNLNRQLFSTVDNLDEYKVDVIALELKKINPQITVEVYKEKIQDIKDLKTDYMIDCVDNIDTKIYLSKLSSKLNIPLLHGSCAGWYGQVGWMSPKSTLIEDMYASGEKGLEEEMFVPPFIASVVASFMVSEFAKMINQSKEMIVDQLLLIDLLDNALIKSGSN